MHTSNLEAITFLPMTSMPVDYRFAKGQNWGISGMLAVCRHLPFVERFRRQLEEEFVEFFASSGKRPGLDTRLC